MTTRWCVMVHPMKADLPKAFQEPSFSMPSRYYCIYSFHTSCLRAGLMEFWRCQLYTFVLLHVGLTWPQIILYQGSLQEFWALGGKRQRVENLAFWILSVWRINASHLLVIKSLAKYHATAGCNEKNIHGRSIAQEGIWTSQPTDSQNRLLDEGV